MFQITEALIDGWIDWHINCPSILELFLKWLLGRGEFSTDFWKILSLYFFFTIGFRFILLISCPKCGNSQFPKDSYFILENNRFLIWYVLFFIYLNLVFILLWCVLWSKVCHNFIYEIILTFLLLFFSNLIVL